VKYKAKVIYISLDKIDTNKRNARTNFGGQVIQLDHNVDDFKRMRSDPVSILDGPHQMIEIRVRPS
jgi:hypothetical protein